MHGILSALWRAAFYSLLYRLPDAISSAIPYKKYVKIIDLLDSNLPYSSAWDLQLDLMQHHMQLQDEGMQIGTRLEGGDICVGTVIVCQHSSTYTLGSATAQGSGPFSKILADGSSLDYETFKVERAGQATYHGPGQLVVYPILDLTHFSKDIHLYLRGLEQTIIDTLDHFDITSKRIEGLTGVWTVLPDGRDSKIAALGIKLRRWVTMHGLSLNVCPDMRYFENIVPCGISDKPVTSMQQLNRLNANNRTSTEAAMGEVTSALLNSMSNQFCVECRTLSPVEVAAFISHITHTYGHFRPNYASLPLRSESAIRDEVP